MFSLNQTLLVFCIILTTFIFNVAKSQNDDAIDCYQCETDVFESYDDMKNDNCYTLKGINMDQNCTTQQNVCSAVKYRKENSADPTNK